MVKVLQEQANGHLPAWLGVTPLTPVQRLPMQPFSAAHVLPLESDLVDGDWLAARIPMLTGPGRYGPLFHALKGAAASHRLPFFWDRILD